MGFGYSMTADCLQTVSLLKRGKKICNLKAATIPAITRQLIKLTCRYKKTLYDVRNFSKYMSPLARKLSSTTYLRFETFKIRAKTHY